MAELERMQRAAAINRDRARALELEAAANRARDAVATQLAVLDAVRVFRAARDHARFAELDPMLAARYAGELVRRAHVLVDAGAAVADVRELINAGVEAGRRCHG